MTEYINYWKNYVNFSDRTTVRGYWMAFLFSFIAGLIVSAIVGVTELAFISTLWSLVNLLPNLGISVRRLRDAGKHWAWIFINLIPLIGQIIFIVMLCKRSVEDDGTPVV